MPDRFGPFSDCASGHVAFRPKKGARRPASLLHTYTRGSCRHAVSDMLYLMAERPLSGLRRRASCGSWPHCSAIRCCAAVRVAADRSLGYCGLLPRGNGGW